MKLNHLGFHLVGVLCLHYTLMSVIRVQLIFVKFKSSVSRFSLLFIYFKCRVMKRRKNKGLSSWGLAW